MPDLTESINLDLRFTVTGEEWASLNASIALALNVIIEEGLDEDPTTAEEARVTLMSVQKKLMRAAVQALLRAKMQEGRTN